jgi:Copine
MMGPTKFAPIIRECRKVVEASNDLKMYFVMMILTDGEIHDMEETINEIADIALKNLPVSFVIVGVGSEDFSNMVRLDGDDVALKVGASDIVQFVKYQEVVSRSENGTADENLASLVLEEIPNQFVRSFLKREIYPK